MLETLVFTFQKERNDRELTEWQNSFSTRRNCCVQQYLCVASRRAPSLPEQKKYVSLQCVMGVFECTKLYDDQTLVALHKTYLPKRQASKMKRRKSRVGTTSSKG